MTTFTQKHYKEIAKLINDAVVNNTDVCKNGMVMMPSEDIVALFADFFQNDNSKFKPHLFNKACGVE